jgi:F0F1-type ATP synthase assembly protein I
MTDDRQRMWRLAGRFSAVGIEMAAAVAFGTLGGYWLDGKLGTAPWLFWFGLVVGIGAAVRTVVRVARTTKLDEL